MPYPTFQKPTTERAAAALFGTVTGLIVGGQDDAARYVVDQLGAQMLRDVHALVNDHTDPALVAWLRERLGRPATAPTTTGSVTELSENPREREKTVLRALRTAEAIDTRPDPVVDPEADAPSTVQEKLKRALRTLLTSTSMKDVTSGDAYQDLVGYVAEACERDEVEPIVILKRLGARTLSFVEHADNPAAYLARQVADWMPESVLEATAEERH